MTDLRTAAQQALDALEGGADSWQRVGPAIDALRAALAEPEPPPEAQTEAEKMAYCAGWWDAMAKARKAEPVQQGCDHCNQPLYAAVKCRVCGRVTEPSHQPVAWIHTDPDNPRVKFLEWREDEPGYRGNWIKTPLYTSPQR